ncbi:MAG TPA: grasp-with-spasm system SPASM domain peptide maturase [Bacteroidia bacterium]|nr:grasp-with-spasm system SPASM domain peptide maturase [Bacteroidia bacterium]
MSNVYMQFSNCIPVKGFNRTAIYDLQRYRYILTSNFFYDLLIENKNKLLIDNIEPDLKDYLDELIEDEWGLIINKETADIFPSFNLQWDHYSTITNSQIDFYNDEKYISDFFGIVVPQLEELTCKHIQVNFLQVFSYNETISFLSQFDDTNIESVIVHMPYVSFSMEQIQQLFEVQPRLMSVVMYDSPKNLKNPNPEVKLFYTEENISVRNKTTIYSQYFALNIPTFTESQKHNTYYNRKLCIDAFGNIKNDPEHERSFGNIKNNTLKEAINSNGFKDFWFIHKEMIDVCKECEFKHMCVDASIPLKRDNNTWFRSTECNYNPYISKWENEEGYKTLKECGVEVNEQSFKIDLQQLMEINTELWNE